MGVEGAFGGGGKKQSMIDLHVKKLLYKHLADYIFLKLQYLYFQVRRFCRLIGFCLLPLFDR